MPTVEKTNQYFCFYLYFNTRRHGKDEELLVKTDEIWKLNPWSCENVCFITLSVFYCFSSVFAEKENSKVKNTSSRALFWTLKEGWRNKPCCWETNPLSVFPFWCIGLLYDRRTVDFLRRLCCPLCFVFCV